ncbi:MAG: class I SAM-dependent methyltransferase [Pseudomonadota bacterium]
MAKTDPSLETVHPWEAIAQTAPYYGVLTVDEFWGNELDEEALDRFYTSGRESMKWVRDRLVQYCGAAPVGRGLDVGCGVGRLTSGMAMSMEHVVGYDISASMVERARRLNLANADFTTELPDDEFDWINSFIVFQHIPPSEGYELFDRVIQRVKTGGYLSLQITLWRERHLKVLPHTQESERISALRRMWRSAYLWWRMRGKNTRTGAGCIREEMTRNAVKSNIAMHDYDFNRLHQSLIGAGYTNVALVPTNHGGHHGAWIFARRC